MSRKLIAGIAALIWEACWAYVYLSAPVPDARMDTIFALAMGVVVPVWLALVMIMALRIKHSVKRR